MAFNSSGQAYRYMYVYSWFCVLDTLAHYACFFLMNRDSEREKVNLNRITAS